MDKKYVKGILGGRISGFAERVAPIYKLLDWRWCDSDSPPTQGEIEQCLGELIESHAGEVGVSATGGLEVFYDKENGEIGIRFTYCDSVFF